MGSVINTLKAVPALPEIFMALALVAASAVVPVAIIVGVIRFIFF